MSLKDRKIVLVGCGNMGTALLHGWIGQGANHVTVLESLPATIDRVRLEFGDTKGITITSAEEYYQSFPLSDQASRPELVVFAIKPQIVPDVVSRYAPLTNAHGSTPTLYLSIAAGIPLDLLTRLLGKTAPVVRAMPNTPAAVGKGATVAIANTNVTPAQHQLACDALQATGTLDWVTNETLIDAVTALSGSGPAYVFYLVECMAQAGVKLGLPPALAQSLARQTIIGSGHLLAQQNDLSAEQLRHAVTSPKGTTAAALTILMENNELQHLLDEAMQAAATRAQELAQQHRSS